MSEQALATITVPTPGPAHQIRANELQAAAKALLIRNPDEYEGAAEFLKGVKGAAAAIEEERVKLKKPILDAGRGIDNFFKAPLLALSEAEKTVKQKLVVYSNEQEKKQREEQAAAEARARKEREALEEKARKAQEEGKLERAAMLEERAVSVVAPVIDRTPQKVAGINYREVWKFQIVDEAKVPRQYCSVDETKIRKVVQALKSDTQIEGVRVYMEKDIAAGGA